MKNSAVSLVVLFWLFAACEHEAVSPHVPIESKNGQPKPFAVNIAKVSGTSAVISWGPVIDPDNDPLYHFVKLNSIPVTGVLTNDGLVTLEGLNPETRYEGEVIVTDSVSEPIAIPFYFRTTRHILTFSRMLQTGGRRLERTMDNNYLVVGTTRREGKLGLLVSLVDTIGYNIWSHEYPTDGDTNVTPHPDVFPISDGYLIAYGPSINKVDHDGKMVWRYLSENGFTSQYGGIALTEGGDILIAGTGNQNASISRFSNDGKLVWEKRVHDGYSNTFKNITKLPDRSYLVTGTTIPEFVPFADAILTLSKIDEEGNVIWSKKYPDGRYCFLKNLLKIDDGIIITANVWDDRDVSSVRIIKADFSGDIAWDQYYSQGPSTSIWGITKNVDEGFAFVGSFGTYSESALFTRINDSGAIVVQQSYAPEYMDFVWSLYDVVQTPDLGFVMVGGKGAVWTYEDKELGPWILKTDESGKF